MEPISYQPIGVIRTPFKTANGMPVQAIAAKGVIGTIELDPAYQAGLQDINGFSHLILLYHLHLSKNTNLQSFPFSMINRMASLPRDRPSGPTRLACPLSSY